MRVLTVADGTRGDVQPMTVLAQQLQREGHAITFAGPPSFRAFVEAKGLTFTPLAFDTEAAIKANASLGTGGLAETLGGVSKLFLATTDSQLRALPELARACDFVLVGGIHTGVPTAAEYAGVPWRWVLYTPVVYPSDAHPPLMAALGSAPRFVNALLWRITQAFIDRRFGPTINAHRKRLGLAAVANVAEHILCSNPILAMEPELAPIPPEWPRADVIGYLDPGDDEPLPDALEAFIARGPAPVYIGFGSMPDAQPQRTTQLFAAATARAGVRAVISRGWANFGQELPEHCMAVGPVSHARLFERMAAIVHHGGAGTTAASARAGKPQLIVPHAVDQFFFGNLVHEIGIGVEPLRRTRLREAALAQRLMQLVQDRALQERAAELGARLRERPRPTNLSRLLVVPARPSLPVLPLGRRISIVPPGAISRG